MGIENRRSLEAEGRGSGKMRKDNEVELFCVGSRRTGFPVWLEQKDKRQSVET